MALNPSERYTSARALADDIERWLADEPVSAFRDPFLACASARSAGTEWRRRRPRRCS